jgi:anti-anti-sigma factor
MSLQVTSRQEADTARLTLIGRLDAATAPVFQVEIEKAARSKPQRVVLEMAQLDYMASAGIRMLLFAKQKMGAKADVVIVGAQEAIVQTLEMTGVDKSVIFMDRYETVGTAG